MKCHVQPVQLQPVPIPVVLPACIRCLLVTSFAVNSFFSFLITHRRPFFLECILVKRTASHSFLIFFTFHGVALVATTVLKLQTKTAATDSAIKTKATASARKMKGRRIETMKTVATAVVIKQNINLSGTGNETQAIDDVAKFAIYRMV